MGTQLIQRCCKRSLFSLSKTLIPQIHRRFAPQSEKPASNLVPQNRFSTSITPRKSPVESNLLRLLCNQIEYESDYEPPQKPATRFKAFTVEDRPGEQWVTLTGKSAADENIKVEATMFDGYGMSIDGEDNTEDNIQRHISLLVDISKGEGSDLLEFVCSAWPDRLEIQKAYVFNQNMLLSQPYTGPNFKDMNKDLQRVLLEYLKARGVNDALSVFMHEYMSNKDRIEHIQSLKLVKSYVEK